MDANAPAFPHIPELFFHTSEGATAIKTESGMTLRAYIATKVMAEIAQETMNQGELPIYAAKAAIKFADALIAELNKP